MERDPHGGSDYGLDLRRDMGDEPPGSMRDTAPDVLAPIDASAPVSGHLPAPAPRAAPPGSRRHTAPDVLAPSDAPAPVSGHVPATEPHASVAETPEHDWKA